MMSITKHGAKQAMLKYESLKKRMAGMREKTEEITAKVVRTTEVGAASFGMGILQGRTGGVELMGVPLELGLGLALNLAGISGAAGNHSSHLQNFGDGCLAAYAATIGRGVGMAMKQKVGTAQSVQSSLSSQNRAGAVTSGTGLTPEELEALSETMMPSR